MQFSSRLHVSYLILKINRDFFPKLNLADFFAQILALFIVRVEQDF